MIVFWWTDGVAPPRYWKCLAQRGICSGGERAYQGGRHVESLFVGYFLMLLLLILRLDR